MGILAFSLTTTTLGLALLGQPTIEQGSGSDAPIAVSLDISLAPQDRSDGLDLPAPDSALRITLGEESTLRDLLDLYSAASGIHVMLGAQESASINATQVMGFEGGVTVPGRELQGFVEGILRESGFLMILAHGGSTPVVTLRSINNFRSGISGNYVRVASDKLDLWADNRAFLIETMVTVPELDARMLNNSLRPMLQSQWNSMAAVGVSDSILLRGTGEELNNIAASMVEANAMARERRVERQQHEAAARDADQASVRIDTELGTTANGQTRLVVTPSLTIPEQSSAADQVATPPAERPQLLIQVFQIDGQLREIADVLEDLTNNRHQAENQHSTWYRADHGEPVKWPRPRFIHMNRRSPQPGSGGPLIVQATAEDLAWIAQMLPLVEAAEAAHTLAEGQHAEAQREQGAR